MFVVLWIYNVYFIGCLQKVEQFFSFMANEVKFELREHSIKHLSRWVMLLITLYNMILLILPWVPFWKVTLKVWLRLKSMKRLKEMTMGNRWRKSQHTFSLRGIIRIMGKGENCHHFCFSKEWITIVFMFCTAWNRIFSTNGFTKLTEIISHTK